MPTYMNIIIISGWANTTYAQCREITASTTKMLLLTESAVAPLDLSEHQTYELCAVLLQS